MTDHVDVLIIGAGLSGVGAGAHLTREMPDLDYAILERRDDLGGTWDLFTYPGIRSDSDMHTLGYRFKPWRSDKVLADGPSIKRYVRETAEEYAVTERIRFGHQVTAANWDSEAQQWQVNYTAGRKQGSITANYLWSCAGYYSYDDPYTPDFNGMDDFNGQVVHPQHWPSDLDYRGKEVVVIGSGATAVTLVPSMAPEVSHITMLQRSPSYVVSIPSKDPTGGILRKVLPESIAAGQARWRNVLLQAGLFQASRRMPNRMRALLRRATVAQLPKGYDVDTHFKPAYAPWDQRMCMVPDGDLFKAIRSGKASVATGHIDTFTETGIRLADGTELAADIIVTATGLNLELMGGVDLAVDGEVGEPHDHLVYRGCMLDGLPNFVFTIGYANASWTLKADLVAEFMVRVIKEAKAKGAAAVTPMRPEGIATLPLMPLSSGYVTRKADSLPQAGTKAPWQMPHNYLLDIPRLRFGKLDDGFLAFAAAGEASPAEVRGEPEVSVSA